jgi:Trk K+ transport system NAD-binding subunit
MTTDDKRYRWLEKMRLIWRLEVRPWLDRHYWAVLGIMSLFAFTLGFWGWMKHFRDLGEPRTYQDVLYLTLQLFTVESGAVSQVNWQLDIARFLAPASTLYAAITALALVFRDELQMVRVRMLRDHVVICGLGRRGLLLAENFLDRGIPVVAIERDTDSDWIIPCREQGAIVVYGDAANKDVLSGAGVHRADSIIAVCGEDGINAEIAVNCRELVKNHRKKPLKCVAQIEDPDLCYLLKGLEFAMAEANSFRLQFFNSHIRGAKLVVEEHPPFDCSSPMIPHILVVGIGRMGENVVVQAARMWRNHGLISRGRLRITLIDRKAEDKRKLILLKNPLLEPVCILEAHTLDVQSSEFFAGAFLYDNAGVCDVSIVYVCLDSDSKALAAGLALLKHLRGRNVPIVVRTTREGGLSTLFQGADEGRRSIAALHGFGLLEKTCKLELVLGGTHEILAQAMYEEHIACGCFRNSKHFPESWRLLSKEYQEAYRLRADSVGEMIRKVGCTLETLVEWDAEVFIFKSDEEEILAKSLHDGVMAESSHGSIQIPPGFGGMKLDTDLTPVKWERRLNSDKEAYREEVRHLPAFLSRIDLQIYRLD